MTYDAEKNYEKKLRNWELIKEAHLIKPNDTSRELLKQAEDDLKFAKDMLKGNKEEGR